MAVLGGTGEQGRGLARRLAMGGARVIIGSRDPERAREVAGELAAGLPPTADTAGALLGDGNHAAAQAAGVVIVAVPWAAHEATLREVADVMTGKVLIDCVNPLERDAEGIRPLVVAEGSAAEQAAELLPDARVVAAFHHISAKVLLEGDEPDETDVLVVGDDRSAKDEVIRLVDSIAGLRGVDGGPLRLAAWVEGLTAVLISVNRRYKARTGIRLSGLDPAAVRPVS